MQANPFRSKWLLILIPALLLIAAGLFFVVQVRRAVSNVLWEFSENDVNAKIEIKRDASGRSELLGTFTPTLENFHLYSKDLPKGGLNGLGRPTLLEVVSPSAGIRLTGPLKAYQTPHDLNYEPLNLSFPVYPAGAVTLGLPFEFVNQDDSVSVELSVTYMACSDQTCLAPVIDRRFTVNIPRNP